MISPTVRASRQAFGCALALSGLAACTGSQGTGTGETAAETSEVTGGTETVGASTSSTGATEAETETAATGTAGSTSTGEVEPPEPLVLEFIEEVTFYDGYAGIVDEPLPEGIIRHSNALIAKKLSAENIASIQNTLDMRVYIGALCDNYDRIGNVFVALAPKGAESYVSAEVTRFEIARFITPFMNKNKSPKIVPFDFDVGAVVPILKDPDYAADYDFWLEVSVFGVPYAANTEVSGCEGRNDVFRAALTLESDSSVDPIAWDFAIPLATSEAFNNYQEGASDEIGTTTKTIDFELDADTVATQLVLITSNHGANQGGEEYNRRDHFVSVDGEAVLTYKPGRESCEPFRMYNTQGNGIYGPAPRTDEEWQSFSNWCPGDVIDTRIIDLGAMTAGAHHFVIDVPDAVFVNGEGNIPFSLYLQGR